MEDSTAIKFEINIAAERMINQVLVRNEHFEKALKSGIEKAIDGFDFEDHVIKQVQQQLHRVIQDSASWGKLREMARQKADAVVDAYIAKEIENFEKDLNEQKAFTAQFKKS